MFLLLFFLRHIFLWRASRSIRPPDCVRLWLCRRARSGWLRLILGARLLAYFGSCMLSLFFYPRAVSAATLRGGQDNLNLCLSFFCFDEVTLWGPSSVMLASPRSLLFLRSPPSSPAPPFAPLPPFASFFCFVLRLPALLVLPLRPLPLSLFCFFFFSGFAPASFSALSLPLSFLPFLSLSLCRRGSVHKEDYLRFWQGFSLRANSGSLGGGKTKNNKKYTIFKT